MITKLHSLLIVLALAASLHQAAAQGTAFTYQGRLNDGTNPANGQYDFQFQVFDAATAGASYGSPNPNTVAGVGVSNGLFTVRSEEHTSELQSLRHLVCRLLL